jgi:hypothetical protein
MTIGFVMGFAARSAERSYRSGSGASGVFGARFFDALPASREDRRAEGGRP